MSAHQDFARETWHLNAFNMCEVIVIREGADARGHRYINGRHQVRVHLYENVQAAANAVRQHNAELSAVAEGSKNTKKRNANGSQSKMNTESIAMTAVSDETGRGWLPLKYEDGPDFCTVTFATGAAFALTVHPERMKLMEAALSARTGKCDACDGSGNEVCSSRGCDEPAPSSVEER